MSGFVAINREATDHPALQNANHYGSWLWLLCHCRWSPMNVRAGHVEIVIEGGQICFTSAAMADSMGWNRLSVMRCLRHFERHGLIEIEAIGRHLLVTVIDRSTFFPMAGIGDGTGAVLPPSKWTRRNRAVFGVERIPIPTEVRNAVFDRDGGECTYCGDNSGPFEIDHIVAVVNGGTNDISNLCVACEPCNRSKGAKNLSEWSGCK